MMLAVLAVTSCKQPGKKQPAAAISKTDRVADSSKTFLLTPFILSQVQYVDSTPLGIELISDINGRKDSSYISKKQFDELAYQFIRPDLNDTGLSKKYREENFYDESTDAVIQHISTVKEDVIIRSAQVYLDKENGNIKGVYLEKNFVLDGNPVNQKLRWKKDRHFQVITIRSVNGKEIIENQKIIWDGRE
jgi:hypothetical protein